ncbi:aldehyde dehydrogenase [Streptomyces sp. NPDC001663]|uniref:aldehyde dehydrogenase n=1 Tax=Streptomyces sp. NPDC001663 TaxID=3364597 RepID=UPI0036770D28
MSTSTKVSDLLGTSEPGVYIDGGFHDAADGARFETVNPATDEVLADVAAGDAADIDRAVQSGARAFRDGDWSFASPGERRAVLLRLADLVDEHTEELAMLESLDGGKLLGIAREADIPSVAATIRWYGEALDKIYDEIVPTGRTEFATVTREPLGVVGAVTPWNFPLYLATWKLAPALAAGNSVVLKPAEQTPLSALRFAQLAKEAGLPDGVLNVVPGYGHTAGKALGLHHDVDCICFTGSTEVGKYFLQYSGASNMKPVWTECGGKNPNIIFSDADLERAAGLAADGVFYHQGQVCSAPTVLLVHRDVKADLIDLVIERAKGYRPGDPLDENSTMGPLIDRKQVESVMGRIERGRSSGRLVLGGETASVNGRGCFVEATVFDDVDPRSELGQEEIFGPVLSVVGFDDEAEAIAIANGTDYGLSASVWTRDLTRAHRVSRLVRAGTVSVNTVDAINVAAPFGGFKQSGIGRDLSLHALDKYTGLKTTWMDLS